MAKLFVTAGINVDVEGVVEITEDQRKEFEMEVNGMVADAVMEVLGVKINRVAGLVFIEGEYV